MFDANSLEELPSAFNERQEESFEDYTAVTDWEIFTQSLENLLLPWVLGLKRNADDNNTTLLTSLREVEDKKCCGYLKFGQREFELIYHRRRDRTILMNEAFENQLCEVLHFDDGTNKWDRLSLHGTYFAPLFWFSIPHLFLIRPIEGQLSGGTRLSLLLSSIEMAVNSVHCPIPVLVEYRQCLYFGLSALFWPIPRSPISNSLTTNSLGKQSFILRSLNVDFSSCNFRGPILPMCTNLNGLRDIFLSKLGSLWNVEFPHPNVHTSATFIYALPTWTLNSSLPCQINFSIFSFDLSPMASVDIRFSLATVWSNVPLYAVSERPTYKLLRPEGADDWYLQLCIHNPLANGICARIETILSACFPVCPTLSKSATPPFGSKIQNLSSDEIIKYLLFLFPDADSESTFALRLSEELKTTFSEFNLHPLLIWKRFQNRASPELLAIASQFGFVSPLSLTHRLSVLITNLLLLSNPSVYQTKKTNNATELNFELVKQMLKEFLLELKLRLDREICLSSMKSYEQSECSIITMIESKCASQSVINSIKINKESPISSDHNFTQCNYNCTEPKFSDNKIKPCFNLHDLLERFNTCIKKIRDNEITNLSSDFLRLNDNVDVDDTFFDVDEESHYPSKTQSGKDDALCEARAILDYLNSVDLRKFLISLLPHMCFECLICLCSLAPPARLHNWYSSMVDSLIEQIQQLVQKYSVKQDNRNINPLLSDCTNSCQLFREIFELIINFSLKITCLIELLTELVKIGCTRELESDIFINFLMDLVTRLILKKDESLSNEPYLIGWLKMPAKNEPERGLILHALKKLFDSNVSSKKSPGEPKYFQFTSEPQTWISPIRPVDLRRPDWELYKFTTINKHSMLNPGLNQLFVQLELNYDRSDYASILFAGLFSQDTQFY